MVPYPLNGRPTAFWRGDWFVGKGVAHARLRYGAEPEDVVDVFNTHTHAAYASDREDSYRVHRAAQAWTLAKLLRGAAEKGHLVIAAGDFNMTPLSPEHRIITGHAPVRDVWRVLHPDSSLGCAADESAERERNKVVPSAEHNLLENGVTSNSAGNTWRWPRSKQRQLGPGKPFLESPPPGGPDPHGKRLDYIFTNTAARELGDATEVGGWVVQSARVGMLSRHPELGCSLSDHFSVEATLTFHQTLCEGTAALGTSIAGQNWPLPPGRLSNLSAFRRSASLLVPPPASDHPATVKPSTDGADAGAAAATDDDLEDRRSPAAGAFLSLQSPTPSTSRPSLHQAVDIMGDPDFDTQLLSSLSLLDPASHNEIHFTVQDYDKLLREIKLYASREADQAQLRTFHFLFWVFVLVACCIAVWFIPTHNNKLSDTANHAIHFVLLLLSSLGLVAGAVDGLMSLLFFRGSENRALNEFKWEVRNAKALVIGQASGTYEEAETGKY